MFEAKIKIEVERLDEILGAAHALASALATLPVSSVKAPVAAAAQVEEPKPKRKAAKKAAPVVEEPAETEVAPAAEPQGQLESKPADPVESDTPVTLGELQGLCVDVAKAKGKDTAIAIIQSMGASGLSKIPESKYAALRDALRGAL